MKVFICGRVHDINPANLAKIETKIQKHIDKMLDRENLVTIKINIIDDKAEFIFKRNNLFAKYGIDPEFINDSDAQLIVGLDGKFMPPRIWENVVYFAPYRYNIPLHEFVYAYFVCAEILKADEVVGVEVESTKTELKFILFLHGKAQEKTSSAGEQLVRNKL